MFLRQIFSQFLKIPSGNKLRQQKFSFLNSRIPLTAEEAALKLKKLKSYEKLSEHEADVISVLIGNCLGDASLGKRGQSYRISFFYSKTSFDYVTFLREFYSSKGLCSSEPLKPFKRKGLQNSDYSEVSFSLYAFKSFRELHVLFLREANDQEKLLGRKFIRVIPDNIETFLTPLSLAIWFLDDGYYHQHESTITLATHRFSKEDVEKLQGALKSKFRLDFNIQKAKETQFYLYLSKNQALFFIMLIKPYIPLNLYHKIGLAEESISTNLLRKAGHDIAIILEDPENFNQSKLADFVIIRGSFNSKAEVVTLSTQQRPLNEVLILQQLLKTNFDLSFTIKTATKTSWVLRLSKNQIEKLSKQIKPFLRAEDYKKIGLDLNGTLPAHLQPVPDYYKKLLDQANSFTAKDLAFLFMLRGSFHKRNCSVSLSLPLIYNEQVAFIQKLFYEQFKLNFTKNQRNLLANGKSQWRLVLSRKQVPLLQNLIQKYVTPDKLYKLGL